MIITRTPYRISLFGGGTDYPAWFHEHTGAVLSMTINKYCYISVRYLPPFFEHKSRVVYGWIESVRKIDEIRHPSARECLRFMGIEEGVEIHHDGDLPARAGIGSSSAFTVGLLNALHNLKGQSVSKLALALEAIHVEQDMIKETVGCQDQVACAVGGLNLIKFNREDRPDVQPVKISEERISDLESHLLLMFTGFPHRAASEVAGTYCFDRNVVLTELYQMTLEGHRILTEGNISEIGRLLHEGWQLKKQLSPEITSPYIDWLYQKAMTAGATGGKLLGAGAGGFMVLFAEPERHDEIRASLAGLLFVPFKCDKLGSQVIFNNGR